MFQKVLSVDDLWSGEMRSIAMGAVRVLLVRIGDSIHAYEDRCAHQGMPLSEGRLEGRVLTCRAHLWQYDVETGQGINPRSASLARLAVRLDGESVMVDVPHGRGA